MTLKKVDLAFVAVYQPAQILVLATSEMSFTYLVFMSIQEI